MSSGGQGSRLLPGSRPTDSPGEFTAKREGGGGACAGKRGPVLVGEDQVAQRTGMGRGSEASS